MALTDPRYGAVMSYKKAIRHVLESRIETVRDCYIQKGLAQRPRLSGRIVVEFQILDRGTVAWSRIDEGTTLGSKLVEDCVGKEVCGYIFPPNVGLTIVKYPYQFSP